MKKVEVLVSAKTLTQLDCVKLLPAQTYTDSIIKGVDYENKVGTTIKIINYCSQSFNVSEFILFTDTNNGGNFQAKLNAFTINANQTLNLPVIYNGIYLGSSTTPSYNITVNGITNIYNLVVSVQVVNHPPTIADILLELNSEQTHIFTLQEIVDNFTDVDGDTFDALILEGNVANFYLNNIPYVSGTEITTTHLNSGLFKYVAPNIIQPVTYAFTMKVKDSYGNISQ